MIFAILFIHYHISSSSSFGNSVPAYAIERRTPVNERATSSGVRSCAVRCHDAKAELEGICEGCDALGTTRVLANDNRIFPVGDVRFDPPCYQLLGYEVVNGAFEEALHLASMKIDCDNMIDAGNVHEVGQHSSGNCSSMGLLLGLTRVGKVWHDS